MRDARERLIAVCGLDCTGCELRLAPTDEGAAAEVAAWFRSRGWLKENKGAAEVRARGTLCAGCHGDRTTHWSADCKLLQCCVDKRKLKHCSDCPDFVCPELSAWAARNSRYAAALARLKTIREERRMQAG